ncbi:MAG: 5,10-methylenetetrahydrofolate reductase [Thermoproteus sp.]
MRIIAELPPSASRRVVVSRARAISDYTDTVDIPDSPGGRPSAHAIAVAYVTKEVGLTPIAHIRLRDLNELAYRSLLGAAKLLGLEYLVPLSGDLPSVGRPVDHLTTEEAVPIAREYGFKVGVLLSMRRNYVERLKIGADFYLALNLVDPKSLEGLTSFNVYPYVILRTERNADLVERLKQPAVGLDYLRRYIEALEPYVKAVVISAPGDFEAELSALALLARR